MRLYLYPHRLCLREPFTVSHGTRTHQETLIVELRDGATVGLGEAPAIFYYGVTVADMQRRLTDLRAEIEAAALLPPDAFAARLRPHLHELPFALAALDTARHDLEA
ncbi:MAG: dipeptide epimerase, partial [Catalinimonas sp.]